MSLGVPSELVPLFCAALSFHVCRFDYSNEADFNHAVRTQLEPHVFQYLQFKYGNTLQERWNTYTIPKESDKALIIVERRCHPNLLFVLQNAVYFARGYALHIFCSAANVEYIRYLLGPQRDNVHLHIQFQGIGSPAQGYKEYNELLKTLAFWEQFQEEHLITLETDCYFLAPLPDDVYMYDYVASRWTWLPNDPGGGGLSYRKRSMMVDICKRYKESPPAQDAFASEGIKALGYTYPDEEQAKRFFTEAYYSLQAIGTHQWWTYCPQILGTQGEMILAAIMKHTTLAIQ